MEKQTKLTWTEVWRLINHSSAVIIDQNEVTYAQLRYADEGEPEYIQLQYLGHDLHFVEKDNLLPYTWEDPFFHEPVGPVHLIATDGKQYELTLLDHMDLTVPLMELEK